MSRERYRTSDEGMVEEFGRVVQLIQEAHTRVPNKTTFVRLMNEANGEGLNWIEALEYVIARRGGPSPGKGPAREGERV